MVGKAGRGITEIGFIAWQGKAHEIEYPDGRKDEQTFVNWADAENRLLLEYLKNENKRTNEQIALRSTEGSAE